MRSLKPKHKPTSLIRVLIGDLGPEEQLAAMHRPPPACKLDASPLCAFAPATFCRPHISLYFSRGLKSVGPIAFYQVAIGIVYIYIHIYIYKQQCYIGYSQHGNTICTYIYMCMHIRVCSRCVYTYRITLEAYVQHRAQHERPTLDIFTYTIKQCWRSKS